MENLNVQQNVETKQTSTKVTGGLAIASLVLGIIALVLGWTMVFGFICGFISIILGIVALVKKQKPACPIIGIVLSVIGILVSIVMLISIIGLTTYFSKNIISGIKINTVEDVISGHSWEASDGSLLVLDDDGTFRYYRDQDDRSDYYYEGTYKVYCGEDAVEYIAEDLEEYGVTEEEQREIFERNEEYNVDNYYCMVLTYEKCFIDGENTLEETVITPYFGFYYEKYEELDFANMNTATYYYFEKVD